MKKLFLLLSFVLGVFITSCSNSPKETILKEYETIIGKSPSIDGNVYNWTSLSESEVVKAAITLKEKTDKVLGFIPTESEEMKVSAETGDYYSSYIWENSEIRVNLWIDYNEKAPMIQLVYREK